MQTISHTEWLQPALAVAEQVQHLNPEQISSMGTGELLALAAALGWASGIRLYLVVFLVGAFGYMHWLPFDLPSGLQVLQHPAMLIASFALLFVEFFADKIPGLDTLWDGINAFIRVPAGAALAAAAFGADDATMMTVVALLGGGLAATSFSTKATTRLAANTSPEPLSNAGLSLFEDGLVVAMTWLAVTHPLVFGVVLVVVLVLSFVLLWLLWRFLRTVWRRLRQPLWAKTETESAP